MTLLTSTVPDKALQSPTPRGSIASISVSPDKFVLATDPATNQPRTVLDRLSRRITHSDAGHGAILLGFDDTRDVGPAGRSLFAHDLGRIIESDRILTGSRIKRWWMGPVVSKRTGDVPVESQFLLARLPSETGEDMYVAMVGLIDGAFRSTFAGNKLTDNIILRTDSGDGDVRTGRVRAGAVLAAGTGSPHDAVHRAFAAASDAMDGAFRLREDKPVPESLDFFGWCTWDAVYSAVDPDSVRKGVRTLQEGGAPPAFLIIDDGWQSVDQGEKNRLARAFEQPADASEDDKTDNPLAKMAAGLLSKLYRNVVEPAPFNSRPARFWRWLSQGPLRQNLIKFFDEQTDFSKSLVDFKANSKFEGGGKTLRSLVDDLKASGVRSVTCWHAIGGYWSGVSPVSEHMAAFEPQWRFPNPAMDLLMVEPAVAWDTASFHGVGALKPDAMPAFYNRLHAYLADSGVDGVKVDAQSGLSPFGTGLGSGAPGYVRAAVHAMEDSAAANFGRRRGGDGGDAGATPLPLTGCMCHSTENLLSFRRTPMVRAGDDFYPKDEASHHVHIATVAYNSVFLSHLANCDWDMFQSVNPAAPLHAAARAVSGGAVYVSDPPGQHDFKLLRQLVLPDGSVLRAKTTGRPTIDCLFEDVSRDGKTALKVWNVNEVNGVVAAFNVQGSEWNRRLRRFMNMPARHPISVEVSPSLVDLPSFQPGGGHEFAIHSFRSGAVRAPVRADEAVAEVSLTPGDFDIFVVAPIHTAPTPGADSRGVRWAALGLVDMMNGGGAVREAHSDTGSAVVRAAGSGRMGLWAERRPSGVELNGLRLADADVTFDEQEGRLELDLPNQSRESLHTVVMRFD